MVGRRPLRLGLRRRGGVGAFVDFPGGFDGDAEIGGEFEELREGFLGVGDEAGGQSGRAGDFFGGAAVE